MLTIHLNTDDAPTAPPLDDVVIEPTPTGLVIRTRPVSARQARRDLYALNSPIVRPYGFRRNVGRTILGIAALANVALAPNRLVRRLRLAHAERVWRGHA